ncbi:MAG: zinc ribbon domain-containing protein [Promethearchaeati archaeon]
MGRNAKKEAQKLGFHNLPLTILYSRPKEMKMMFNKYKPDTAKHIGNYMKTIDPSFIETNSGGPRSNTFYLLAEQAKLYVELENKMAAYNIHHAENHVERIKIYSDNPEHAKEIAKTLNQLWEGGILPYLEPEHFEEVFKVGREELKSRWDELLGAGSASSTISVQKQDYKKCEKCGAKNLTSANFCIKCGEKF